MAPQNDKYHNQKHQAEGVTGLVANQKPHYTDKEQSLRS